MMTQEYVNVEDCSLETIFLFPIEIQSVVSKLTCEFTLSDGTKRQLETKIESRERAEVIYEDKVASGQTAVIGTYTKAQKDMVRINIGNFPPLATAVLRIFYC